MSEFFYNISGLRFWNEQEIMFRDHTIERLHQSISNALKLINQNWAFHRIEGPILTPRNYISGSYDETDIFTLNAKLGEVEAALRAETTASSYLYAKHILETTKCKLPLCVWQVGKSFRREMQDGARWGTLRLNEFYQAEWQCIYSEGTMANYREIIEPVVGETICKITRSSDYRIINSDRLPSYSLETRDVEVKFKGKWREMCSISTRTDFPQSNDINQKKKIVLEIAVGLDRLIAVEEKN